MRIFLKLFVSLKSAIILIALIAILSTLGTLIPQNREAFEYMRQYPKTGRLIIARGFNDMYRSNIFRLCLCLLSISTLLCVITRWKFTSRRLFSRLDHASEKELRAIQLSKELNLPLKENWKLYFTAIKADETGCQIAIKTFGKSSLLGGILIHIGLLVLLFGGLIGVYLGVETVIRGCEGDKVPIPSLKSVRAAIDADKIARHARDIRNFSPDDPRLPEMREQVDALHAVYRAGVTSSTSRIAFDKLWVENYETPSGEIKGVKSWNSKVRFLDANPSRVASLSTSKPIHLKVNHPVSHGDYTFYQASWNKFYRKIKVRVDLTTGSHIIQQQNINTASFPQVIELTLGMPFKAKWYNDTAESIPQKLQQIEKNIVAESMPQNLQRIEEIVMLEFFSDLRVNKGKFENASSNLYNPAAMIVAYDKENKIAGRAWSFPEKRMAMASHVTNMPFRFTYLEATPTYESGLQMTHDPGKPFVWLGCFIFTVGMIMSFYIAYIEYWAVIYPDGSIRISVLGNRPAKMLENELTILESAIVGHNGATV